MTLLFQLMFEFMKIGLFAVGGGPATIPFLYDLCDRLAWFSVNELSNMIAISQCTPGPIGLNMATYVGYATYGVLGGVMATLSLVFPSIVVVVSISKVLDKFKNNAYVLKIFSLLRPCVVGFIMSAAYTIFMTSVWDSTTYDISGKLSDLILWKETILFIFMTLIMVKYKKHPIVYLAIAMCIGIVFQF